MAVSMHWPGIAHMSYGQYFWQAKRTWILALGLQVRKDQPPSLLAPFSS